ncbi:LysR family transcriptional regulator [Hypericibacter terrae]|uniref:LysR family transcriptional regulator n=1 Tax=Hypericibacter terrae TaxID=2602015 RepID=A0A5J6MEJ8_9PROT|nr:LysR family transcriptional regulator [Hypericibacter terrae]QEX15789.1 LysR family transcriptional regulator [Hypericibacter terrae]
MTRQLPELTAFDLRLLQVFDAVVAAGSFTAAEVKLNKSKSAISTDIAALETRLGVKLCRRGRAGFGLTDHGRQIHEASLELFRGMSGFRDSVGRIVSRVAGEFTIAMDDDLIVGARAQVADAIRLFTLRNPDVFINLRSSSPEHVTQLVLEAGADIGVNVIPRRLPELTMTPLFSEKLALYCSARHPIFPIADGEITADILAQYDCIDVVTPQGAEICEAVERMRVTARATSMESRLMLILTGRYVGFLPRDLARAWAERGEIRAINMPGLSCGSTGYAIFRRDAAPNVARDLFLADLTRAFKPARPPVQDPKRVLNGRPKTVFQAEAGAA